MTQICFDSIPALKAFVGRSAVSDKAVVVDQAMIDTFGRITQDTQWVHVDPARAAAESPFGTTIAHGLLTLALITSWYNHCFAFPKRKFALNYGFNRVRFINPVPSGSRLVGGFQLAGVEDVALDEVRCSWSVRVQVEKAERPALAADWLIQLRY